MSFAHKELERAILKSQHCQRNWDLSRQIPQADLEVLITAMTQCPSKQNIAFYQAHLVTNRQIIEQLHDCTDGFTISYEPHVTTTNSQVLANLVVVFEEVEVALDRERDQQRNAQTYDLTKLGALTSDAYLYSLERDKHVALGVAAGYLNLTATLLGYATGCCSCFSYADIKAILGLKNNCHLMMGIGFRDPELGRRIHHLNRDFVFPTKPKQPIKVNIIS